MSRLVALSGCLLVVGLSSCNRDAPTEPRRVTRLPSEQLAVFADALQDARVRILPNLGTGTSVQPLSHALEQIEGAIPRPDAVTDFESALQRANGAVTELRADTTLLPDLDVVALLIEQLREGAFGPSTAIRQKATATGREQ